MYFPFKQKKSPGIGVQSRDFSIRIELFSYSESITSLHTARTLLKIGTQVWLP